MDHTSSAGDEEQITAIPLAIVASSKLESAQQPYADDAVNVPVTASPAGWRFWMIITGFCVSCLLVALEASLTSTALPTIVFELQSGELYIWIVNAFFLGTAVVQPFFAQMSNIVGRRILMITSVVLFMLGSGICGGATSTAMLIGGRTVQGLGSGGIQMLIDLIIADLVPLRERSKYMGILFGVFALGTCIGPIMGGAIVQHTTWQWAFYLNLPIAALALAILIPFLQVKHKKEATVKAMFRRVDFVGNTILTASVAAILIALTYGGTVHAWSAWNTIVPLVLGFFGFVVFQSFESLEYCVEPSLPARLFNNRTTSLALAITFIHGLVLYWTVYFLPLYFQSVKEASPVRSGVLFLPSVVALMPAAVVGGILCAKTGRYKPFHMIGFALMTIGLGCFTLLTDDTSIAVLSTLQIVVSIGSGLVLSTALPAVQADLPESDVAVVTGAWAFCRSFGSIWGVSIPAAIFDNRFDGLLSGISSPDARQLLQNGNAYMHASQQFTDLFSGSVKEEVIGVYSNSLKRVWQISIAFVAVGFLLSMLEKEVVLREILETDFGLADEKRVEKVPSDSELANLGAS